LGRRLKKKANPQGLPLHPDVTEQPFTVLLGTISGFFPTPNTAYHIYTLV
jgi:hypothetical protein